MATNTTTQHPLLDCPACHQAIVATMSLELELQPLSDAAAGQVDAHGRITGLQVAHDCRPRAMRTSMGDDDGPHSRACGISCNGHGVACHASCPTCHGKALAAAAGVAQAVRDAPRQGYWPGREDDPVVRDACRRQHPGQPCQPGRNHPGTA